MIDSPEGSHVVQVVPAAGVHRGPGPEVAVGPRVGHLSLPPVSAELNVLNVNLVKYEYVLYL